MKTAYLQFSLKEKENSQSCPQKVNIEIRNLCTITTVCAPLLAYVFHAQQVKEKLGHQRQWHQSLFIPEKLSIIKYMEANFWIMLSEFFSYVDHGYLSMEEA